MTKTFFTILSILYMGIGSILAQNKKISATLSYPVTVGDNFVSAKTGIADLGLQLRFVELGPLQIGVSSNANLLRNSSTLGSVSIKESALLIQPRVFGELNLPSMEKLSPFMGLGYTFTNFKTNYGGSSTEPDLKDNYGGLNVNLGVAYNITDRWFVHLQYDMVRLSREGLGNTESFFNNIDLIKIGGGIRF